MFLSLKNFLKSNLPLIAFLSILLLQNVAHVYLHMRPGLTAPEGHAVAVHQDDSFYIAMIRQTMQGGWKFIEPHTTRSTPAIIVCPLYIVGGKIAAFTSIDPALLYYILQISGSIAANIILFILIKTILPKSLHLVSVFIAFFVESGPRLSELFAKPLFAWTAAAESQIIMTRNYPAAHHSWGLFCAALLLLLFLTIKKNYSPVHMILIIILSVVGTLFSPSLMAVSAIAIYVPFVLSDAVRTKNYRSIIFMFLALFGIGTVGLWMKVEFNQGLPWATFNDFERAWFSTETIFQEYTQSWFLYVPWILLYICAGKRQSPLLSNTPYPVLMFFWILIPAVLILLEPYISNFPFANWRIAWGVPVIPFAVLATLGVDTLRRILWKRQYMANVIFILFLCVSFFFTVQFTKNLAHKRDYINNPQQYPPIGVWKSFSYLDTLPRLSGVLTGPTYGEIIPAYADVRTFIGVPHAWLDWQDRNWLSYYFYSERMTAETADDFLRNNDISYVFFGPEEYSYKGNYFPLYPSLLKVIYEQNNVMVYEVLSAKSGE